MSNKTFAVVKSSADFDTTIDQLERALINAGNKVFARIDQAAEARAEGLTLRPTVLLLFGNPFLGTPIMDGVPVFALDLPLKMLVWREGEEVFIAYNLLSELAKRFEAGNLVERITAIDTRIKALVDSVAK